MHRLNDCCWKAIKTKQILASKKECVCVCKCTRKIIENVLNLWQPFLLPFALLCAVCCWLTNFKIHWNSFHEIVRLLLLFSSSFSMLLCHRSNLNYVTHKFYIIYAIAVKSFPCSLIIYLRYCIAIKNGHKWIYTCFDTSLEKIEKRKYNKLLLYIAHSNINT